MPPKAKRSSETTRQPAPEDPNSSSDMYDTNVRALELTVSRLRSENQELKRKIKNEQSRNEAVIDRVAMLLDTEYRRRRREEKDKFQRYEARMFEAGRRRQRGEEGDENGQDDAKKKNTNHKEDKDTTSTEENAAQRKQNRWDFEIPDNLPVTRQNLALYNLVQSLKEAQDSGISVFRVLDYIRAGIVPAYGGGDEGAPLGNPRLMPIRSEDRRRQLLIIDDSTDEEYYRMVQKQSKERRHCADVTNLEEKNEKVE